MMPKMIFNVVNALMFGIQIYLIYHLAQSDSKKQNAIMFFLTFAFIWLFQPAFPPYRRRPGLSEGALLRPEPGGGHDLPLGP